MVCYDWTVPAVTATFDVLVGDGFDGPTNVTATLDHTVVSDGYGTDTATADLLVNGRFFLPMIFGE